MHDLHQAWLSAMRSGDFPGAWEINDAVIAARDPAGRDDPALPYHLRWVWDGRPLRGRRVLVRCYHGLGDTLQFARYLPALGGVAASVTVEAQPELVPLLSGIAGVDRLAPFDPAAPLPPDECDIEIMELAHALRLPPEAAPPPYVARLSGDRVAAGRSIGLCWQAGNWDPERSLPAPMLPTILQHPSVARRGCFSLQPWPTDLPVLNPPGCSSVLAETAMLIAGLEQVVTVDSMVAHLAGAMNRPVHLLLKHEADWRWMTGVGVTPWYPATRLYRQQRSGDWAPAIAAMLDMLG